MLEDNKDKIDPKQAEETKKLRDDLQKSLDENNMEEVKAKLDMLEKSKQCRQDKQCITSQMVMQLHNQHKLTQVMM